jgi:hypothetical protein
MDIVQIRDGKATATHPRDDGEGTSGRAAGFIAMLDKFRHEVSKQPVPLFIPADHLLSSRTWISR